MSPTNQAPFRLKANARVKPSSVEVHTDTEVTVIQTPEAVEELSLEPYSVVDTEKVSRPISYGDGYDGTVYRFDRQISYEEFIDFCKKEVGINLYKLTGYAWYEDHSAIVIGEVKNGNRWNVYDEGRKGAESKVWTYLWVRAYTD